MKKGAPLAPLSFKLGVRAPSRRRLYHLKPREQLRFWSLMVYQVDGKYDARYDI